MRPRLTIDGKTYVISCTEHFIYTGRRSIPPYVTDYIIFPDKSMMIRATDNGYHHVEHGDLVLRSKGPVTHNYQVIRNLRRKV